MKVCTFNIWSDAPRNARWTSRRGVVAGILQSQELDLFGLQEATAPMIHDIQDRLPEFSWVGAGRDDGRQAGEFTPIFFHKERMRLLEHGHFWLAADCSRPGRGWDAIHSRIVTWARVEECATGRRLLHFNTHLDHLGRNARLESARLLLRKGLEIAGGDPVMVTGDFNCRESARPYRIMTGQIPFAPPPQDGDIFRDTYYDCEHLPEGPRRTYLGVLGWLGFARIDYIFVHGAIHTSRHRVIADSPSGSDHRPVVAELRIVTASP